MAPPDAVEIPVPPVASHHETNRVRGVAPAPPIYKTKYMPGMKVRHRIFGEGIIISSTQQVAGEKVTVAFVGHGVRILLGAAAKLELVDT